MAKSTDGGEKTNTLDAGGYGGAKGNMDALPGDRMNRLDSHNYAVGDGTDGSDVVPMLDDSCSSMGAHRAQMIARGAASDHVDLTPQPEDMDDGDEHEGAPQAQGEGDADYPLVTDPVAKPTGKPQA